MTTDASESGDPAALKSLDLVFQLVREQYSSQQSYITALDAKAGFILGSATLLTGVLAVWQVPRSPNSRYLISVFGSGAQGIVQNLPLVAIGVYLAVVLTAYVAYVPFWFSEVPEPNALVKAFLVRPELETKKAVLATTLAAFQKNRRRLSVKSRCIQLAFGALLLEILLVAMLLIAGILN